MVETSDSRIRKLCMVFKNVVFSVATEARANESERTQSDLIT